MRIALLFCRKPCPLIFRRQRNCAVKGFQPAVNANAVPRIHHYFTRRNRQIFSSLVCFLSVNIPSYAVLFPLKCVSVKILRSVKTKIIHIFVLANTIGVVIELHLCCVLAKDFNIYFVPRIILRWTCVCKER